MNDRELFIIGANGQLGLALRKQYPKAKYADKDELDITDKNAIDNFDWTGVKVIINAAAYTNVDGAETLEGRVLAWKINSEAVASLVEVANINDIALVHISTDYVFDGTKTPHKEIEELSPLSVYGASKASGDIAIGFALKHYLIRTSWVIGDGKNFVRAILEIGKKGINPNVIHDQVGRLTFTTELVRGIDHLLTTNQPYGTYNITNSGEACSLADISREIFKVAKLKNFVTNTTTVEYYSGKQGIAVRPLQSTFDLGKITKTGFVSNEWRAELINYINKESL